MLLPAEEILLGEGGYHIECGIFEVRLHWQPFLPESGALLCTNRACFRPLRCDVGQASRGRTPHPLPDALPPRADVDWHTEHEDVLGLVCGGPCLKAHRLARDPATVRRTLRQYHVKLCSTVFCQHCGVDCLMLVAQLKGLRGEEERRCARPSCYK